MATKKITLKMLEKLNACEDQVELFEKFCKEYGFSEAVAVNLENLKKAHEYGLDIVWAIRKQIISVDLIIGLNNPKYSYYCLAYTQGLSVEQKKALKANIK